MKFTITVFLFFINYTLLISCSCSPTSFCGVMGASEESVIFKGETIKIKDHDNGYHSAIIKVLTKIKGEQLLTDTVELFGGINQAGCEEKLNLQIGEINYFALFVLNGIGIDLSQFEHESESYWVSHSYQCFYQKLIIDGNFVKGRVSKEFDTYPLESFEQDLVDCSFSVETLQEHLCSDFKVYPNPVESNIFLQSTDNLELINELKIYSTTGQLLFVADSDQILNSDIPLPNFDERLVFLEITCGVERIIQKLVIVQ